MQTARQPLQDAVLVCDAGLCAGLSVKVKGSQTKVMNSILIGPIEPRQFCLLVLRLG